MPTRHPVWKDRAVRTAALIELGCLLGAWGDPDSMKVLTRAMRTASRTGSARAVRLVVPYVTGAYTDTDDTQLRTIVTDDLAVLLQMTKERIPT